MAGHRTTIVLDEQTRQAARELAARDGCSLSEAIRRAVLQQHERASEIPLARQKERKELLERLFELFEGNDPETEIRRLKSEDEGF
jgi:hypothetical protein